MSTGWGRRLLAAAALAGAIEGCSCGRPPAATTAETVPAAEMTPAAPPAPDPSAPRSVTGHVTAVAPGGGARGLAGAEVLFLPEAVARPFLAARLEAAEAALRTLGPELAEARAARARALGEADRTNQAWKAANGNDLKRRLEVQFRMRRDPKGVQAVHRSLLEEKQEAWRVAVAAASRSEAAERSLEAVQRRADLLREGAFFLSGLPAPLVAAAADAEGRFTASLPPGRYAVVATAELGRDASSALGVWILWIRIEAGADLQLELDGSNRHGSGCRDCAVALAVPGPTAAGEPGAAAPQP